MLTNIDEVTKAWKGTSDELSNILKTQKDVYLEQMRAEYVMKLEFEIEAAKIDQQMADDALAETKERIQSALDLSSSKELRKLGAQLKSMGDVGVDTYIDLAQALNRIDDDDVRIKNEIYSIVELIKGLDAMASESEETSDAIDKLTQKHEYYEKLLQGYSAETLIDEASEEKAEESGKKAGKNIILSMVEGMMSEEKVITDYVGNLADELEKQTESKVLLSDLQRIASVAKKKFGVDLKIPALATGSVIPPNRQFLAVLGDNKQEPEVVAPLSTIRQAVTEALSARGYGGSTPMTVVLELDGKEFGRAVFPSIQRESSRIGMKFVTK